jgi:hypothetical protein
MSGAASGLLTRPSGNRTVQVTATLMSAYEWLQWNEPDLLKYLYDPIKQLTGDAERAANFAEELNAPFGVMTECALNPRGIKVVTFPSYIWELVYPA